MKHNLLIVFSILLMIGVAACSPMTSPTEAARPVSQATSPETFHPLSTRIGIEEIDMVLDALETGDVDALHSLIRYTTAECTRREGLGGPPKCRDGEAEGTLVEVLSFIGSEGGFLRKDEMENWHGVNPAGLYAVYEVSPAVISEQYYPPGKYVILLVEKDDQSPVALRIDDGGIVRVDTIQGNGLEALKAILDREAGRVILASVTQ